MLGKLGRGGFASVYKVRNRLDQGLYAVKKISLKVPKTSERLESELTKMLREVRHLARARHSNVVGYNQAWVEVARTPEPPSQQPSEHDSDSEGDEYVPG